MSSIPLMMRRTPLLILGLGTLAIGAVLVFTQLVPKPLPTKPRPTLQEIIADPSVEGVETRPLLTANLPALPPAPLNVTVLSVTIAPGISSRPTALDGPALVFVEQGHVVFESDRPLPRSAPVGPATIEVTVSAGYHVGTGEHVSIPDGALVQIRNPDGEQARLVIVALTTESIAVRALATRSTNW
jgi:hypothetical protein